MNENATEKGRFKEKEERPSRALRRKAELLGVVFGLPKPNVSLTFVENTPKEFNLPEEMIEVFGEIMRKEDSNEIEYLTAGDIRGSKLFFSKIRRGEAGYVEPSVSDILLNIIGLRRIMLHSHRHSRIPFSPGDTARLLLNPAVEIDVVIARILEDKYTVSIAIKARENLAVQKERYLAGKFLGSTPRMGIDDVDYVTENLEITSMDSNKLSAILRHNGCVLYSGVGDIDGKNLRVFKNIINPHESTEFEEDPRTKLMLPKV